MVKINRNYRRDLAVLNYKCEGNLYIFKNCLPYWIINHIFESNNVRIFLWKPQLVNQSGFVTPQGLGLYEHPRMNCSSHALPARKTIEVTWKLGKQDLEHTIKYSEMISYFYVHTKEKISYQKDVMYAKQGRSTIFIQLFIVYLPVQRQVYITQM